MAKKPHKLTQPLKTFGGQGYMAPHLVSLFPRHLHYVEAYAGGLAVLLERDPNDESLWLSPHRGVSEVVNDLNEDLMVFWRVLALRFDEFLRRVQAVPLSRREFELSGEQAEDPVERAANFFIRCRQSRAGSFKGFTQLTRSRLRRGINGNASEWLGAIDGLAAVHARLQPVVLECMDAIRLIRREDGPGSFFYADPPFLPETRVSQNMYKHEMTAGQHEELLAVLAGLQGKFLLSGYRSKMYDAAAKRHGWRRFEVRIANHASGAKTKEVKTSCGWTNYDPPPEHMSKAIRSAK